ncbi:MAG: M48 family metallopeptidase [Tenericutes bacterium]|nr:M48 family metallopeptidase [Mycoplasmatota bacterium]
MMFESITKNKVKTFFIITFFIIFVMAIVYFISLWLFEDSYIAVAFALIISLISALISYFTCDKMVLSLNGARIATKTEFLQLNEILEGLCIAANLPLPKLYVIESDALNAFATGRNPKNSVICVTTGLIKKLDKNEMEGVLAHELSHIKNYDILVSTIAIVMVGLVSILADLFSHGFYRTDDGDDDRNPILMIIGLIFIILSPIFANLLNLMISRNREYLADATAVSLTRNNEGLIKALMKIDSDTNVLKTANETCSSLYISDPFKKKKERDSIFSTHPSIANRIERLRNIK